MSARLSLDGVYMDFSLRPFPATLSAVTGNPCLSQRLENNGRVVAIVYLFFLPTCQRIDARRTKTSVY